MASDVHPSIAEQYPHIVAALLGDDRFLSALRERLGTDAVPAPVKPAPRRAGSVTTLNLSNLLVGYLGLSVRTANMIYRRLTTLEEFESTDSATIFGFGNIGAKSRNELLAKRRTILHRAVSFRTEEAYERAIRLIRDTKVIGKQAYREVIPLRAIVVDSTVFPAFVSMLNEHSVICVEVVYKEDS